MKKITSWFEDEIIDNQANYLKESGEYPEKTDEELYQLAQGDPDLFEIEWENMCNYLTEIIEKKNKDGYWKARVSEFGWRKLDGTKYFKATDGKKLISEILPDTDCSFNVFSYKKGFAIQNYHHDSPMGNEWYYILPCSENTYEKNL